MRPVDYYYRAFEEYKTRALSDRHITDFLRQIRSMSSGRKAKLSIEQVRCEIDEDWVLEIENNLKYIEKAISQERQFIRTNGEVVLIEKTKSISKESISHLAKHASLIKEVDEETNQVKPEKIYTVEKLSDFAVYENKFLYFVLVYLKDFVNEKYNKIIQNSEKYFTVLELKSVFKSKARNVKYDINIEDENMSSFKDGKNAKTIQRIEDLLSAILKLLSLPLMVEVSKVPMIKPPITKTNVLKMETNFKYTLALYEYIATYSKPGFSVIRENNEKVLTDSAEEDFNNTVLLQLFLMQMYSTDIKDDLEEALKEQIMQEEAKKNAEVKEKLDAIKAKAKLTAKDIDEYLLLQNERIEQLESAEITLKTARDTIQALNNKILALQDDILVQKQKQQSIVAQCQSAVDEVKERSREQINAIYGEKAALGTEINELKKQIEALNEDMKKKDELVDKARTQNDAFRNQLGIELKEEDYTQEGNFKLIEKEYKIIENYYNMAWKKTKKRLAKEILFRKDNGKQTK